MKIVILGSRKQLEPLEILYMPETKKNDLIAEEECHKAIIDADEIWIYTKQMGSHTQRDIQFSQKMKKQLRWIWT